MLALRIGQLPALPQKHLNLYALQYLKPNQNIRWGCWCKLLVPALRRKVKFKTTLVYVGQSGLHLRPCMMKKKKKPRKTMKQIRICLPKLWAILANRGHPRRECHYSLLLVSWEEIPVTGIWSWGGEAGGAEPSVLWDPTLFLDWVNWTIGYSGNNLWRTAVCEGPSQTCSHRNILCCDKRKNHSFLISRNWLGNRMSTFSWRCC